MKDPAMKPPTTGYSLNSEKLLSIPAGSRIVIVSGGNEVVYYFEKLGVVYLMTVGG